jgi:hypothetical protein
VGELKQDCTELTFTLNKLFEMGGNTFHVSVVLSRVSVG